MSFNMAGLEGELRKLGSSQEYELYNDAKLMYGTQTPMKEIKAQGIPKKGELSIAVHCGRDLEPKDLNGLSDPYALFGIVKEGQDTFENPSETFVCEKTLNPVWNERCAAKEVDETLKGVLVVVMDKDTIGRDEFMGQVFIPVENFVDSDKPVRASYDVQPREGKKDKVRGKIDISIHYRNLGLRYKQKREGSMYIKTKLVKISEAKTTLGTKVEPTVPQVKNMIEILNKGESILNDELCITSSDDQNTVMEDKDLLALSEALVKWLEKGFKLNRVILTGHKFTNLALRRLLYDVILDRDVVGLNLNNTTISDDMATTLREFLEAARPSFKSISLRNTGLSEEQKKKFVKVVEGLQKEKSHFVKYEW